MTTLLLCLGAWLASSVLFAAAWAAFFGSVATAERCLDLDSLVHDEGQR